MQSQPHGAPPLKSSLGSSLRPLSAAGCPAGGSRAQKFGGSGGGDGDGRRGDGGGDGGGGGGDGGGGDGDGDGGGGDAGGDGGPHGEHPRQNALAFVLHEGSRQFINQPEKPRPPHPFV